MNEITHPELTLSSRKRRIAAFLIDHFIITTLFTSITFIFLGTDFMNEENLDKILTIMPIVMIPTFFVYFSKDSIKGISVGRWIMGIMVRDSNNTKEVPSFLKLFLRNIFLVIWPLEFLILAFNKTKSRIGDKITKTSVINNPEKPKNTKRVIVLLSIGAIFFLITTIIAGTAMKSTDAYKTAISELSQNDDIIKETGGIDSYGWLPTGNVNISNGYGEAQLEIKIVGYENNLNVTVYLTKQPNDNWKLIELSK